MLQNTTAVPNVLFDRYLAELSSSEIKILMVVIRQTLGWRDKEGNPKKRDWISQSQFEKKTSLSRKTISQNLDTLIVEGIIQATDYSGNPLIQAEQRKGKSRIFYALHPQLITNTHNINVKSTQNTEKNTHDKRNPLQKKLSQEEFPYTPKIHPPTERITDKERLAQILHEHEQMQTKRNRWH